MSVNVTTLLDVDVRTQMVLDKMAYEEVSGAAMSDYKSTLPSVLQPTTCVLHHQFAWHSWCLLPEGLAAIGQRLYRTWLK